MKLKSIIYLFRLAHQMGYARGVDHNANAALGEEYLGEQREKDEASDIAAMLVHLVNEVEGDERG